MPWGGDPNLQPLTHKASLPKAMKLPISPISYLTVMVSIPDGSQLQVAKKKSMTKAE